MNRKRGRVDVHAEVDLPPRINGLVRHEVSDSVADVGDHVRAEAAGGRPVFGPVRPHRAPKFKGPQKYNVYTKYSYIVGFILVVNWPNRKQTVPQIYHRRENVDPIRTPLGPFRFPAVTARRGPTRVATQACRDVCTSHQVPPRRRRRH